MYKGNISNDESALAKASKELPALDESKNHAEEEWQEAVEEAVHDEHQLGDPFDGQEILIDQRQDADVYNREKYGIATDDRCKDICTREDPCEGSFKNV